MSTTIRPEVSKKNKYWISKHRYYELKHFCMQVPEWKKELAVLDGYKSESKPIDVSETGTDESSVEKTAIRREELNERIRMISKAVLLTDEVNGIGNFVLGGVINNLPYDKLNARLGMAIPCSRDEYYEYYRKFFYILSGLRK